MKKWPNSIIHYEHEIIIFDLYSVSHHTSMQSLYCVRHVYIAVRHAQRRFNPLLCCPCVS